MANLRQTQARLVASYHILHHHHVFNERGTISIRNPTNPETFITSTRPAICVSSDADLSEWNVDTGTSVDGQHRGGASVRSSSASAQIYIHSCIYSQYPGVQSIVHSPSSESIVYGLCQASGSMTRAIFNEAGFLDDYNPILDLSQHNHRISATHPNNLLVDHASLGDALARSLTSQTNGTHEGPLLPEHGVVFIRGNGAVVWSEGLEDAVHKAVNLQRNTEIQTAAMGQRVDTEIEIAYMNKDEQVDCARASTERAPGAWEAWATEVSRMPLYRNNLTNLI